MKSRNTFRDSMSKQIHIFRTRARLSLLAILALVAPGTTVLALTINFTYAPDTTFTAAGLSAQDIVDMKAANTFAALQFTSRYTDPINVNIMVTAIPGNGGGSSNTPFDPVDSYTALQAAVAADSTTADDATTVGAGGSIPAGTDPIATNHVYNVARAQAKALGLRPDDMDNDGTFTFNGSAFTYDPNNRAVPGKSDFIGLAMHEISEIMGRTSLMGDDLGGGTPIFAQMDLMHYTGAGTRGLNKGPGRSFSFDNGTTLLKAFNDENANMGDNQDWADGTNDAFNAFGSDGVLNDFSAVDMQNMDVIGYNFTTGAAPATPRLGNISTRVSVQTGDDVAIGGFIVNAPAANPAAQPLKVIMRGIGPSLGNANPPVAGALADPSLELHDGTGATVAMDDNWMSESNAQEIINSTVAPTDPAESAILMTLNPGNYTAIERGTNGGTGVGLVEVYNLDNSVDTTLANISTRGLVGTGDNVLIGGFIIVGADMQRVIVRAIGPSLLNANPPVPNALADPTLELHDSTGAVVAMNDNWRSDQEAEIIATTVPPTDDAESAIVQTLAPGNYTAIVQGVNGTTGDALVEVYAIPPAP